jgi:drug/metabolite transporter (DMT)-like permease
LASAVLYAGVNQLQFLGIRVAGAAGYQVLVNCKVVWTGLLSVAILGKPLSKAQWWGLLWLNAGVLAAKYPDLIAEWTMRSSTPSSQGTRVSHCLWLMKRMIGVIFAGIQFRDQCR